MTIGTAERRHIWQPPGSSLCGQCVVSMISGEPLERVCETMGDGYTWPRDMRSALSDRGFVMQKKSDKDKTAKVGHSGRMAVAFMQVVLDGRMRGHWGLWDGSMWLDPAFGLMERLPDDCRASIYHVAPEAVA